MPKQQISRSCAVCAFLIGLAVVSATPTTVQTNEPEAGNLIAEIEDVAIPLTGKKPSRPPYLRKIPHRNWVRTIVELLGIVLVGVVAVLAFRLDVVKTRLKRSTFVPDYASDETTPSHAVRPKSPPLPMPPPSGNGISPEWADFVRERLDEIGPSSDRDETKQALGIVDFLDELKEVDAKASKAERSESASLCSSLLSILASQGFSPVDSDEWNPAVQRAVSVVRNPGATGTKILGKGATGLTRNGKIIRKQEVKIEMKGN